ncbi:MAG TPA: DUF4386 family protein [Hellea balneolensis]|uniref:DUF4386 family protein n=1 Tax=Hellea balneolensis TaxID=287478 RepID=A0A7C3GKH9_9PROT|nr:DUF4386 family protein [Hellea balneolensis]
MTHFKLMKNLARLSILGALIMIVGDYLLFLTPWVSGKDFNSINAMRTMSEPRLMWGGIAGPISALAYAAGSCVFYVALKQHNKIIAALISIFSVITYGLVGAAHCLFAVIGFGGTEYAAGTEAGQIQENVTSMVETMSNMISVTALLSSVLLIYMIVRHTTAFPKWILVVMPLTLTLIQPLITPFVPYPLGSIIIGGWPNWAAVIFFACLLIVWRKRA